MTDRRFDDTALKMLQRVGGEKLIEKMRGLFLTNAPLRLQSVEEAIREGDAAAGANPAHSLKGSAGQLGAVRLQLLCDKLEEACLAADLAQARERLSAARDELPAAIDWIRTWKPTDEKDRSN